MSDRYAVFGNPVEHSLSPRIHSSFAAQTGQDMDYQRQLVALERFEPAAREFFAAGGCGLNITVPFKLDAYSFASQLSKRARQAGAVNTLLRQRDGTVLGDNTDGVGLVRDISNNLGWPLQGRRILILGAGGAVRGVLAPLLAQHPAELVIANRTVAKAQQLARGFSALGPISGLGYDQLPATGFDLVINATSASLSGNMLELPRSVFAPGASAYDLVYGAEPTVFMRWASDCEIVEVADGLGMLVEQAAESFHLWRSVMPATASLIAEIRQSLARAQSGK